MSNTTNNAYANELLGNDQPSLFGSLANSAVNALKTIDTGFSACRAVAGTAEQLALTAEGMAERNNRYITEKGDLMHEARMGILKRTAKKAVK